MQIKIKQRDIQVDPDKLKSEKFIFIGKNYR